MGDGEMDNETDNETDDANLITPYYGGRRSRSRRRGGGGSKSNKMCKKAAKKCSAEKIQKLKSKCEKTTDLKSKDCLKYAMELSLCKRCNLLPVGKMCVSTATVVDSGRCGSDYGQGCSSTCCSMWGWCGWQVHCSQLAYSNCAADGPTAAATAALKD